MKLNLMRTRTAAALGLAAALAGGATSIAASEDAGEPVRDALTGHLADGSIEAKFAPAGFVHNVSQDPSHFLGAYVVGTDQLGSLTGAVPRSQLAEGDEVLLSKDLPLGAMVESGVFKNPGPDPLIAKFATMKGLVSVDLAPGEGVLVGSPDVLLSTGTHVPGCRCNCRMRAGDDDFPITIACHELPPGTEPSEENCNCGQHHEEKCWSRDLQTEGTVEGCEYGRIPTDTGTGND